MIYSIYKIENLINNKVYIGFTNNPKRRFKEHRAAVKYSDQVIHRAIRKYGIKNFSFDIIFQTTDKNYCLYEMEPKFIEIYDSLKSGYNSTKGGDFLPEIFFSEETIRKTAMTNSDFWLIKKPNKKFEVVKNINEYCKINSLEVQAMSKISSGQRLSDYRGFSCRKLGKNIPPLSHISELKRQMLNQKIEIYVVDKNQKEISVVDDIELYCKENNLSLQSLRATNFTYKRGTVRAHKNHRCLIVGSENEIDNARELLLGMRRETHFGSWRVTKPDGTTFMVSNPAKFAYENGLRNFQRAIKNNQSANGYKFEKCDDNC